MGFGKQANKYTGKQVDKYTSEHVTPTRGRLFTCLPVYLPTFYRPILWLLPLSFLIVAFFYPLLRILVLTFDPRTLTTENLLLTSDVFLFTLYQATLSTILTLLLGLPSAYLFARKS